MTLTAIKYDPTSSTLSLLDQRLLPEKTQYNHYKTAQEVASAITSMVVRGAPAIGITAAYGMAIAQKTGEDMTEAFRVLAASRPTAVNLKWALDRIKTEDNMEKVAVLIHEEDIILNKKLGENGAHFLKGGVMHICNTGALATGGHGTALGMIRSSLATGNDLHVYACETRPYNQGSRLTTWECYQDKIPCTLIADSMAAALMATGKISAVVAGCDRVANNGDTANKIGTYSLAVLAKYHG